MSEHRPNQPKSADHQSASPTGEVAAEPLNDSDGDQPERDTETDPDAVAWQPEPAFDPENRLGVAVWRPGTSVAARLAAWAVLLLLVGGMLAGAWLVVQGRLDLITDPPDADARQGRNLQAVPDDDRKEAGSATD